MSEKLKVFVGNYRGRHQRMVAATSRAAAARKMGITASEMRSFYSETGNQDDIAVAISAPGEVFERANNGRHFIAWQRVTVQE